MNYWREEEEEYSFIKSLTERNETQNINIARRLPRKTAL